MSGRANDSRNPRDSASPHTKLDAASVCQFPPYSGKGQLLAGMWGKSIFWQNLPCSSLFFVDLLCWILSSSQSNVPRGCNLFLFLFFQWSRRRSDWASLEKHQWRSFILVKNLDSKFRFWKFDYFRTFALRSSGSYNHNFRNC